MKQLALAMFALASLAEIALAQPAIPWSTIDGGGGKVSATSGGTTYALEGTLGQWDAAPSSAMGNLALAPGYWPGVLFVPSCPADLDNGSGSGAHDGAVTIDDLLFFLLKFESGDVSADLDNGSGNGIRDGAVTIDDLLFFLVHFEAGC